MTCRDWFTMRPAQMSRHQELDKRNSESLDMSHPVVNPSDYVITGVRATAELMDQCTDLLTCFLSSGLITVLSAGLHVLADLLEHGTERTALWPTVNTEGR
ncbi:hypothetical protein Plo01_62440 [Planobispora longispora]|uniref:Uncharacterized protein n=1 Tax=Planobispora longispora TaxID=28887 RepID=A0A8J3RRC8_9ACTN|nr:hypothetical protein GCM10020093_011430 [Planobispora longispora]GIH79815.1 hypothetical protein Plo01_62440 [Planobispora longispora]